MSIIWSEREIVAQGAAPVASGQGPALEPTHTLFIVTGSIERVDVAARHLHIESHVVEVIGPIRVHWFRPGDRVVVNGVRDPRTGREIAIEIVRLDPQRPAPVQSRAIDRSRQASIMWLVVALLVELRKEVQLLECDLLPTSDDYAIRLQIPREVGKALLIPRGMLERALCVRDARRHVRNLLRAATAILRTQRALSDARGLLTTRDTDGIVSHRHCAHCDKPLSADDPVVDLAGGRVHMTC